MNLHNKPLIDLLNKVENPAHRIMLFTVPLRIVRLISTDESFKTFRVEQLIITSKDPSNPRGTWNTLSTHGSEQPGGAYHDAVEAAIAAQTNLRRKLQQRARNRASLVRA